MSSDKMYENMEKKWGKLIEGLDEAEKNCANDNDRKMLEEVRNILFKDYYAAMTYEEQEHARDLQNEELLKEREMGD